jgi:thymidylate kinase
MARIVFEGMDGSGKSTQVERFVKFMEERLSDKEYIEDKVKLYHEPRPLREQIFSKAGKISDSELSYMFAIDGSMCRAEELREHYGVVVRDRDTTISQYAYHHNLGTPDEMIWTMAYLLNQINGVDVIFYIDVDIEVALARIKTRAPEKAIVDYFEKEEKLRKINTNYKELFDSEELMGKMGFGGAAVIRIDGNKPIDEVTAEIQEKYTKLMGGL